MVTLLIMSSTNNVKIFQILMPDLYIFIVLFMPAKKRSGFANDRRAYVYSLHLSPSKSIYELLPNTTPYQLYSPWPQFGGLDNTNSRYTPVLATQTGVYNFLNSTSNFYMTNTSPTIANDGTIYIGENQMDPNNPFGSPLQGYLVAYNPNGTVKWQYQLGSGDIFFQSTPIIGADGTIYFGSNRGYVYAVNPNGNIKWSQQYTIPYSTFTPNGQITASLILGYDNNIYFGLNSSYTASGSTTYLAGLFSIQSTNGTVNWTYNLTNATIPDSVCIDKNSNIFFVYHQPNNTQLLYLVSLTSGGTLRFSTNISQTMPSKTLGNLPSSRPTLNIDNSIVYVLSNIYIQSGGSGNYVCFMVLNTQDGSFAQSPRLFPVSSLSAYTNSLARDNNNNFYFTLCDTNNNAVLYSYSVTNGFTLLYTINAPNGGGQAFIDNTPAIGSDGTIYFGVTFTDNSTYATTSMYAVSPPYGVLKWNRTIPTLPNTTIASINTSPAINLQGNIIVSTQAYAFTNPPYIYSGLYSFT